MRWNSDGFWSARLGCLGSLRWLDRRCKGLGKGRTRFDRKKLVWWADSFSFEVGIRCWMHAQ